MGYKKEKKIPIKKNKILYFKSKRSNSQCISFYET